MDSETKGESPLTLIKATHFLNITVGNLQVTLRHKPKVKAIRAGINFVIQQRLLKII